MDKPGYVKLVDSLTEIAKTIKRTTNRIFIILGIILGLLLIDRCDTASSAEPTSAVIEFTSADPVVWFEWEVR